MDFTKQKALDYDQEVALGNIPGTSNVSLVARSDTIDQTRKIVWGGGVFAIDYTQVNSTLEIVSTSDEDKAGGTGATHVAVEIVLDDYTTTIEIVPLNGSTPVVLAAQGAYIQNMAVSGLNTLGTYTAGDISVSTQGGVERSIIKAGRNRSDDGIWQVPAGFTWFLNETYGTSKKGDDVEFVVEVTFGENGIWQELPHFELYQNVQAVPVKAIFVPEKSFVRVLANSSNSETEAIFSLLFRQVQNT